MKNAKANYEGLRAWRRENSEERKLQKNGRDAQNG